VNEWVGIAANDTIHIGSISYKMPYFIYRIYFRKAKAMKNVAINDVNVMFHEHTSQSVLVASSLSCCSNYGTALDLTL
jgi:hypothetical protein